MLTKNLTIVVKCNLLYENKCPPFVFFLILLLLQEKKKNMNI